MLNSYEFDWADQMELSNALDAAIDLRRMEYNAVAPPARHGFIMRTIAAARSFGINVTHELAFFCALALLYGESFQRDPQWMTMLEEVKRGRLTLQQAVESLEENGII